MLALQMLLTSTAASTVQERVREESEEGKI